MNLGDALSINRDRFDSWALLLAENKATAVLTIGVGHDEHSGELQLCVVDDPLMGKREIAGFLRLALRELRG